MHEAKGVANHLKHCQPCAGFTALKALFSRFSTVNRSGLGTTLSAFWGFGAAGLPTMESTFGLARNGWRSALLTRTFGLGSALLAADAAAWQGLRPPAQHAALD